MGVCGSKLKEIAGGIDKEAIEMGVKGRKVDIAQKTKLLSTQWQQQIAAGQPVNVAQAEVLPLKDVSNVKLHLDQQSSTKDIEITALYVTTNTIARDQWKKEIWTELAAGMKARNMPAPLIEHGEKGCSPAVDAALDKQVAMMVDCIKQDKPLVSEEEIQQVGAYNAKKANAGGLNAGKDVKMDEQKLDGEKRIDGSYVPASTVPGEKDASAMGGERSLEPQRGTFEQNQQIRVHA